MIEIKGSQDVLSEASHGLDISKIVSVEILVVKSTLVAGERRVVAVEPNWSSNLNIPYFTWSLGAKHAKVQKNPSLFNGMSLEEKQAALLKFDDMAVRLLISYTR